MDFKFLVGGAAIIATDGGIPDIPFENLNNLKTKENQVTIFVKPSEDHNRVVQVPNENEFVEIKNVFCVPGEEEGKFKLLCHFFADQVQVLRPEISSVKEIVRRIENLPQPNQVCSNIKSFIFCN